MHWIFLQPQNAQVAELVDALVSNTNVERRVGSSPTLGTKDSVELESQLETHSARFFPKIVLSYFTERKKTVLGGEDRMFILNNAQVVKLVDTLP
jgi:hypothetical protein